MAAAVLGKTEIGAKEFGRYVDVPEIPKAKLMYYLDSICYALDLDKSEANIRRLRDWSNHHRLTDEETNELIILCILFSPDVLINKCIFMDEDMCENDMNKFYELTQVSNRVIITEDILIGGERRAVKKILFFRDIWLEFCYLEPIKHFQSRLEAIADQIVRRQRGGGSSNPRAISAGQHRSQPSGPSRPAATQSVTPNRAVNTGPNRATSATTTRAITNTPRVPQQTSSTPNSTRPRPATAISNTQNRAANTVQARASQQSSSTSSESKESKCAIC